MYWGHNCQFLFYCSLVIFINLAAVLPPLSPHLLKLIKTKTEKEAKTNKQTQLHFHCQIGWCSSPPILSFFFKTQKNNSKKKSRLDAYDASKMILTKIQSLDPENRSPRNSIFWDLPCRAPHLYRSVGILDVNLFDSRATFAKSQP